MEPVVSQVYYYRLNGFRLISLPGVTGLKSGANEIDWQIEPVPHTRVCCALPADCPKYAHSF